jgi:hypothetical protein
MPGVQEQGDMFFRDTRLVMLLLATIASTSNSQADQWDPEDDTGADATVLTVTESLQVHGPHTTSNSVDDADWFSFHLEAGKRYRFESTGGSDTYGNLYLDSLGTTDAVYEDYRAGDAGDGGNFRILYTPMITQDYFLKVTEDQSGGSTAYSLQYINEPSSDNWDPVDDSTNGATALAIDSSPLIHGPHKLGPEDHYDWYSFNLVAGVEYTFGSTGPWDTAGELYNDSLVSLQKADQGGEGLNFIITHTPTNSGIHYLQVSDWTLGFDIEYSLEYYISDAPDADGDQIPDIWEIQYFGSTNAQPEAHGDADLQNNLNEYIAGTDPTNPASFFGITNHSTGSFIVEWPSVAGREYRVLWAQSLTNTFQPVGPVMEYPQNSYTDTAHSAESSGFYKVEVQLK